MSIEICSTIPKIMQSPIQANHVIVVCDRAATRGRVVQFRNPGLDTFLPPTFRTTVSVNQARVKQVFDGIIFYKVIKVVLLFVEDRLFAEGE